MEDFENLVLTAQGVRGKLQVGGEGIGRRRSKGKRDRIFQDGVGSERVGGTSPGKWRRRKGKGKWRKRGRKGRGKWRRRKGKEG